MSTTADDLQSFSRFVEKHSKANEPGVSRLSELFDLWMLQNPPQEDYAENVAAINASIDDFLSGERGTPAGDHSKELRNEFGLGSE